MQQLKVLKLNKNEQKSKHSQKANFYVTSSQFLLTLLIVTWALFIMTHGCTRRTKIPCKQASCTLGSAWTCPTAQERALDIGWGLWAIGARPSC